MIWKDKSQVDLIPFGDLESEGVVTVKGTGFTSMNVEGFREVYEHHSDLFTDNIELEEIAAQFLGREIGKIISGNPKLIDRVKGILENGLAEQNNLADLLAIESYETIESSKSIITHILNGISDATSRNG